jgi:hypothetical protein
VALLLDAAKGLQRCMIMECCTCMHICKTEALLNSRLRTRKRSS